MSSTISLVQRVYLASPCSVPWDTMAGDDKTRYCSHCKLNVYNLSAMTEAEGQRLIIEKEGRFCGAFYRRPDGTILTRDCPVGLAAIRRRVAWLTARVAAAILFIVTAATYSMGNTRSRERVQPTAYQQAVQSIERWLSPSLAIPKAPLPAGGCRLLPPPPPIQSPR